MLEMRSNRAAPSFGAPVVRILAALSLDERPAALILPARPEDAFGPDSAFGRKGWTLAGMPRLFEASKVRKKSIGRGRRRSTSDAGALLQADYSAKKLQPDRL
jgi:hypothetical protein